LDLREFIENTSDLPTLPKVANRIAAEMEEESLTAKSLGAIILDDPSLAAKLLKLANSAFYGMPKQVVSIEKAVMILGFHAVKSLALSISIYHFFQTGKKTILDVQGLWDHSLGCAVACKLLIEKNNRRYADDAFLFGILHDIGKVVFINKDLAKMEEVYRKVHNEGVGQSAAEQEVFGFNHQMVGAALLKRWKFPDSLIAGVKMHHDLPPDTSKLDQDTAQLVRATCVANQLAKALSLGVSTDTNTQAIPHKMWQFLGVERPDLPALSAKIKENYDTLIAAWNEFD
jgi:HD-like signal output (HDOD) protein